MPRFKYSAKAADGGSATGTLDAQDPGDALAQLRRQGLTPLDVEEEGRIRSRPGGGKPRRDPSPRVSSDDLVVFTRQLSTMISAGVPIMESLAILADQVEDKGFKTALNRVVESIRSGTDLSEALGLYPKIFPAIYVNMVKAGEASGKLDEILGRLATFSQRQAELREQLRTALTYPCLLLLVGVAIIGFLVVGIIPKFMAIFLEAHVPLPLPTRVLYAISQMVRQHGLIMLAALIGVGTVVRSGLRTSAGRRWWDATVLRLPVVGPLATHAALCRFSRTFESLASSGVPILDALIMLQETSGNIIYQEAIKTVEDSVRQGGSIAEPLKTSGAFPPMAIQMLSIGEASGTLDHMLGQLAEHYDLLLRHGLKRAMAFVEPLFLGIMGSMVAFIMASVLLPMFRLVNVVH